MPQKHAQSSNPAPCAKGLSLPFHVRRQASPRLPGQGAEPRFEPSSVRGVGWGQVCPLSSFRTMLSSPCHVHLILALSSGPQALSHFGVPGSPQGLIKSVDAPSHNLTCPAHPRTPQVRPAPPEHSRMTLASELARGCSAQLLPLSWCW